MKKYDWKFYYKLILGVLPLFGIVVFFIGQLIDLIYNDVPPVDTTGRENIFYPNYMEESMSWTTGQRILYCIIRNGFLFTTLANVGFAAFFINSAVNNQKEGLGKLDNSRIGFVVIITMFLVVILYNGQLPITKAYLSFKWYTYVSWLTEHSFVQIALLVYFLKFYNHVKLPIGNKRWLWFVYSFLPFVAYLLIFEVIGLLIKVTNGFNVFGDMSYYGYYPYNFMDFSCPISNMGKSIPMFVEYFLVIISAPIFTIALYFFFDLIIRKTNSTVIRKTSNPNNI